MAIVANPSTLTAANIRREIATDIDGRLNRAASEASTGKKVDPYKDLGSGSVELLSLNAGKKRLDGFLHSNELLANRMDAMSATMDGVRTTLQNFMEAAIGFREKGNPTGTVLQEAARAAYDQIATLVNTPYQGAQLFGGLDNGEPSLQRWELTNAATGLSPEDVLAAIVGGGITDAADAAAKAAEVDLVFDSANTAAPLTNFEATFFNGTPLESSPGVPSPRANGFIATGMTLDYGIQANDAEFRNALKGLAMIASVDASGVADLAAYDAWVGAAIDVAAQGLGELTDAQTRLGGNQKLLDELMHTQKASVDLYTTQLGELEGVDPYEAANRVTLLSTQLEATYAISSRLSRLSFLNFM